MFVAICAHWDELVYSRDIIFINNHPTLSTALIKCGCLVCLIMKILPIPNKKTKKQKKTKKTKKGLCQGRSQAVRNGRQLACHDS